MSDEIAEFLRRAAARRAEQLQQQQRMEAQRRAAQQAQQLAPPPAPLQRPMPSRPMPPVVEAEIVDDEPVELRPALSRVAQHVAQHIDTRQFAQRAERLGDVPEQSDERMDAHLHQAFDHSLGKLSSGTHAITAAHIPEVDNEMKSRVASHHPLLAMLANPQSVRNAMIVSELLKRPELD
jgi:hypothetical protein